MIRTLSWAGSSLAIAATIALAVAALPGVAAASTAAKGARCSTHGLAFSARKRGVTRFAVVGLKAHGVSCAAARRVAGTVARDLLHGTGLSISGAVGFGMTQESCSGCGGTTTSVSISYRSGSVTVSLRGSGSSGAVPVPSVPSIPSIPTPGGGGQGTVV